MAVLLLQVTVGAAATQFTATSTPCRQVTIQNNAAHTMRIGDSTVSASKGIYLAAGPGGGSENHGPLVAYAIDLSNFYVFGTQNDVLDVLYVT